MHINLKSLLNTTWKVGLSLLGAGAAVFAVILTIAYCDGRYGRASRRDRTLSKNVAVHAYQDNTVRIWNKETKHYTTKRIRWVSGNPCEGDSIVVYCDKQGQRGYVNINTGEIVIPAQYSKAWNFSEGVAAVLGTDNCVGFIDKDNRMVIDYIIPFEGGYDYVFKDGLCKVAYYIDGRGSSALYRKDGSLALDWSHRCIGDPNELGYRIVCTAEGSCLVDSTFRNVLPGLYEHVEFAPGGVIVTKDHTKQLMDFDGTVIEPFLVDDTRCLDYLVKVEFADPSEYKLDTEIMVYSVAGREGLLDARTGKAITPALYFDIEMISKDLIKAELGYDTESVIMDRKGRIIR